MIQKIRNHSLLLMLVLLFLSLYNLPAPKRQANYEHLNIGHIGTGTTLLPHDIIAAQLPGADHVLEPLIKPNNFGGYDPILCEDYTRNNKTLFIKLRPQIAFSNGIPIKSTHIQQSIAYFSSQKIHPYIRKLCESLTLTIHSPKMISLSSSLDIDILKLLSDIPIIYDPTLPIGSGPYLLSDQNTDQVTYTLNPNYWGEPPRKNNFNTLTYHFHKSTFLAYQAFMNNSIDLYIETSAARFDRIMKTSPTHTQQLWHPEHAYTPHLWLNPHGIFKDPIIRDVLSLALMPDIMNDHIFNSHYRPHITSPGKPRDRLLAASHKLNQNGWVLTKGQREKDHIPLAFNMLVTHHQWDSAVFHLKHQLKRLGITLNIHHVSNTQFWSRVNHQDFDIIISPIITYQYSQPRYHKKLLSLYQELPIPNLLTHTQHASVLDKSIQQALLMNLTQSKYIIPIFSLDYYRIVRAPHVYAKTLDNYKGIVWQHNDVINRP